MDIHMQQALKKVQDWYAKASDWQKDLFCAVWEGTLKDEQILDRAVKIAGQEHLGENCHIAPKTTFPGEMTFFEKSKPPVILKEITNVEGVGALAPTSPLQFGHGLTVVYGENGSGKSSYVRILKALENHLNAASVLENVFDKNPIPAKAEVLFSVDGTDHPITWTKSYKAKCPLQIYDTAAAKQFVDKENEVVYEPKTLSMITQMAGIYEQVSSIYKNRQQDVQQRLSKLDQNLALHPIAKEYESLSSVRNAEDFAQKYQWDDTQETKLTAIIEGLKESDPIKAATAMESRKKIVRNQGLAILELIKLVGDEACESYLKKRNNQIETKKAQDALVVSSRKKSLIDGFGGDVWRSMWTHANAYINLIEQSKNGVPVSISGKCALCQQDLDTSAKDRMQSFKDFYESRAMQDADDAFREFSKVVNILQAEIENKLDLNEINEMLVSSEIPEEIQTTIMALYRKIISRCEWLLGYDETNPTVCPEIESKEEIIEVFRGFVTSMDVRIKALKDASADQEKLVTHKNELNVIKWVASNIPTKLELLKLQNIISDCKTNSLTTLKKDLSRLLITDAYISRFQTEMKALDERGQIKVELTEASPKRGKSYHQVSLRGAKSVGNHKNGEVLSEGEFRVVSLAAFLADLSAWGRVMPFVFDDPITSLDHKFEARVAARLVKLSLERQVIVFTHRLAFAQLLDGCTTEHNLRAAQAGEVNRSMINHIELRNSPLGHPGKANYLQRVAMKGALSDMINQDCARIKKEQNAGNFDVADHMLQSLAARFRNLIEQGIEHELLHGIVTRFDYRVFSQKLPYLFALTEQDIALFHGMMSKYSCYDHSHSVEKIAPVPEINELEKDLNEMLNWVNGYKKRSDEARRKAEGKA